ncbi:hypothetical protein RHGRI_010735 [Rhododendron griersonianum]|uniref:RING-type E3 ubiquitin transferase (cysteine targeting) n=1 Tax=Rhododendron griersonianum TaxID=479676 RepID=A0AAV6KJL2_9ERIC|nr:hypothetical protein RHGRI_010735 [Rhododendron griersonianum]
MPRFEGAGGRQRRLTKIQEDLQENEMLVEVIHARMKEADAKASDLKASFENLCESAKREIDAFEEEERELILIEEDLHSKEAEKIHYEKVMNNKVLPEIKAAEAQYEELKNLHTFLPLSYFKKNLMYNSHGHSARPMIDTKLDEQIHKTIMLMCLLLEIMVVTGLEGPGLTVGQKLWYCVATVGGQYIWARLQSFSAFHRWGDSEQRSVACRAWTLIQRIEGIYKAASFGNLLIFLYTGRYVVVLSHSLGFCEYVVTGKDAGTGSLLAVLAEAGFLIGLERNRSIKLFQDSVLFTIY